MNKIFGLLIKASLLISIKFLSMYQTIDIGNSIQFRYLPLYILGIQYSYITFPDGDQYADAIRQNFQFIQYNPRPFGRQNIYFHNQEHFRIEVQMKYLLDLLIFCWDITNEKTRTNIYREHNHCCLFM